MCFDEIVAILETAILESVAKSLGLALAQAVRRSGNVIRSTKGGLD